MASIHAYSCRQCRAELLSTRRPQGRATVPDEGVPVLCCGRPPKPLDAGHVLSTQVVRRRPARCARCAYAVDVVVHPEGSLVCASCRTPLEVERGLLAATGMAAGGGIA